MTSFSTEAQLREILKTLPEDPGIYKFLDARGVVIYVGKAKNLKKRVSSYFQKKAFDSYKVKLVVDKIREIEHVVVNSESDALLLENNLIKELQPRYNILLKDDKTFPWICIKNEPFPRVFLTRNVIKDGSRYFGPYTSASTARTLLDLIRQLYPLRTCKHHLSKENIALGKFKVCLEYHIGNCLGPCEGFQNEESYEKSLRQIEAILKGNMNSVLGHLQDEMKKMAGEYHFEQAETLKRKIDALTTFQVKSTIVNPSIHNVDVYSIVDEEKYAIVNYLNITKGAVIQAHTIEIQKRLDESSSEILRLAITDLRNRVHSSAKEIIVPLDLSKELPWLKITMPKQGDKRKLLELSERNARLYRLEKIKRERSQKEKVYPHERILRTLQQDLRMEETPWHIECFDNSNIQGSDPVAACVVFKNAKPAKKEYRHYNIKTVKGPDDFASMEEVIYRRYRRLLDEKQELPQLVVIDGGKGQLNAGLKSLEKLKLRSRIAIIGIAKRLEEIYFPDDPVPLYIDKNSESLKLIQQLRNEAHRFGIEFHRLKRSGSMTKSALLEVEGIGESSIEALYRVFKSESRIKSATQEELTNVVGKARAMILKKYFNSKG